MEPMHKIECLLGMLIGYARSERHSYGKENGNKERLRKLIVSLRRAENEFIEYDKRIPEEDEEYGK